jgi:hypothetical protein
VVFVVSLFSGHVLLFICVFVFCCCIFYDAVSTHFMQDGGMIGEWMNEKGFGLFGVILPHVLIMSSYLI